MKKEFINQKCPKCGGNLYLERDYYAEGLFVSWYEQVTCLQCGFAFNKRAPEPAVAAAAAGGAKPAAKQLVTV
ncbi:MAG TPA: hypothetical protein VMW86_01945 [Dehalococcoidales bacterium]|nr:hypothetical protein [Dehalococcoidales bacterium]